MSRLSSRLSVSATAVSVAVSALRARNGRCGHDEDALAQRRRIEWTAHLESAEGALQEVCQPPLQAVIGVLSLQDLELSPQAHLW